MEPTGENLRRWVEALESGRYRQARHYLAVDTGNGWRHCALGVACQLAADDHAVDVEEIGDHGQTVRVFDSESDMLSATVADWLGCGVVIGVSDGPLFDVETTSGHVTELNDAGMTFAEIAAALRDTYGL